MTVLVVTNDFPPRQGGIETFVRSLCDELPSVVVYTSREPGDSAYDAGLPFPVVRDRTRMLLPTARVTRRAVELMQTYDADRVLFGAAAPLGLMGPALRQAGARRIVAMTHGHETWWARLPGTRQALRRIGDAADTVTTVSSWCAEQIAPALSPDAVRRMRRLTPGVDTTRFHPGSGGAELRVSLGLEGVPLVVCVSRLIPRKGQDTLIRAWPRVLAAVPDAKLLLVGGGPDRARLETLAAKLRDHVIFTGPVAWPDIPACFDAADVFALPTRTRRLGLEPEALGIVTLEASATAKPVLVGDSGGTPDTLQHTRTGYLVDPHNPVAVAVRLIDLLRNPAHAQALGKAGRAWAESDWTWAATGSTLRELLDI
ncbi:glycosyltransferase family 4 protein [Kribbella sandramycini]|uniref:Glycosyltransferase family 4 protein n=1 Tax=Kribbella sandramycini TaxID=60450 RepID=A0A7Y4NX00_9ACTN|nr:glycosyltransferase family 4 protein [Kribbella sandramycini]MBB6568496.1 phosphatidylinositol alpha-1,6-mannosyltransferase [Kribbella sandramycini]NOL38916.1 glycosyltransferase family 4 protein [Kribbella sandramycini]